MLPGAQLRDGVGAVWNVVEGYGRQLAGRRAGDDANRQHNVVGETSGQQFWRALRESGIDGGG